MKLTEKEKNILFDLLKIASTIFKLYKKLETTKNKSFYTEKILTLIEKEEQLIELLRLDEYKLKEIEKFFEQYNINVNSILYLSVQTALRDKKYAYCRVLSKLRNYLYKDTSNVLYIISEYLVEYEIALLYRFLIKNSEQEEHLFVRHSQRIAHILLMDAPSLEQDILKRNMEPPQEIVDITKMIDEYIFYEKYFFGENKNKKLNIDREDVNLEDLKYNRMESIIKELYSTPVFFLNGFRFGSFNDFMISNFAVMISLLSQNDREKVYNTLRSKEMPEHLLPFVEQIIELSEKEFLPFIKTISLKPPTKKWKKIKKILDYITTLVI